jgi:hypothetical protein
VRDVDAAVDSALHGAEHPGSRGGPGID